MTRQSAGCKSTRLGDGITQQQPEERLQALKTVPFERYIPRSPVRIEKFLAQVHERRFVLLGHTRGAGRLRHPRMAVHPVSVFRME